MDMVVQLSDSYKIPIKEGEVMLPSLSPVKPLVVEKDANGLISHVGIKLFNRNINHHYPFSLYHFIERYILELLLLPNEQEIQTKLRMERVKITSEIFPMRTYKKGLLNVISNFPEEHSHHIICNNNRYVISCMEDNRILLELDFPVRYELITGLTKLEAENSLYISLLSHKKREYKPYTEEELYPYKDSLYCADEDYYLTEDIVSTSYYKKENGVMVPVFSEKMLEESVYNLINSLYDWGVQVEITQNLYGNKKNTFTESLAKVMDYYVSQGCKLYTGIRKFDKSKLEGYVMAMNAELGYQHLMNFTLQKDLFENPKENEVKMKVYSYIPIHNISTLFEEKKTKR